MRIDDPDTAGHLVIHLDTSSGPSRADIETFREKASPDFVLRAAGQPDVPAHHERGGWIDPGNDVADFYLRVAPADFARVEKNVAYALVALGSDDAEYRCAVNPGVTITRRSPTGP